MNPTKYTVYYLDGNIDVIYGSEISLDDRYFIIYTALDEEEEQMSYTHIPWAVVRKVEEQ